MSGAAILPDWNGAGVLPPTSPGMSGSSENRSPYRVSLASVVGRLAISPERMEILEGLLQFREKLHEIGIVSGFQWLDGSFLEHIELLEGRPPRDMDVVTFYDIPAGESEHSLHQKNGQLFDPIYLKSTYRIDGYFHALGEAVDASQVKQIAYWYSMWSHQREGQWKGFVQVSLDPSEDTDARAVLDTKKE